MINKALYVLMLPLEIGANVAAWIVTFLCVLVCIPFIIVKEIVTGHGIDRGRIIRAMGDLIDDRSRSTDQGGSC